MMLHEFIERTGFEPTASEYADIEEAYYDFVGDKDAFCRKFVEDDGERKIYAARARRIEEQESEIAEMVKAHKAEISKLEQEMEKLQAALDAELDWKLSADAGTNMEQSSYKELSDVGRFMDEDEAKELVAEEFGFAPAKIEILRSVCNYEVNKHSQLREAKKYNRPPVYEATDWNYIRFNVHGCCTMMWEMINGELHEYRC